MRNKPKKQLKYEQRSTLSTLIGFLMIIIMLIAIICGIYLCINILGNGIVNLLIWSKATLSKLDKVVIVALITGTVSIISVLFTSVISKIIEYKQQRRDYLNQKREKSYGQFVDMYYKIMEKSKGRIQYSEDEMLNDMSEFSRELTLWGSNNVVKKWIEFRLNGSKNTNESIFLIEKLLFAMRKDMGFRKMKQGTLLKMTINDYDEYIKKRGGKS